MNKVLFVIYADSETLIQKIYARYNNSVNSSTPKVNKDVVIHYIWTVYLIAIKKLWLL